MFVCFVVFDLFVLAIFWKNFVLCGDGLHWIFPIPCFGCGGVWFFGLGWFPVAVGMGKTAFLLGGYVGWVGWDGIE